MTKVDIVVPNFVQNDAYNKRLCNNHAELIKLEYDNVQRESPMTDEEIRKNRAAINELLIPGRGYTRFTLRVIRQGVSYTHSELEKLNPANPYEPNYVFASYVYNHGYYTITDEVRARVAVPYERMSHTASTKEKLEFINKSYLEFNKMREIVNVIYVHVDAYNRRDLGNEDYHIPLCDRIESIFYEQVIKNIKDDLYQMITEHRQNEPTTILAIYAAYNNNWRNRQ